MGTASTGKGIMKKLSLAVALAALALTAAPTSVVAQAVLSTSETNIGDLLDNPATKAIIEAHLPGFSANPQVEMARGMTLKVVQQFAPDQITDERLAKIDADLAKLSAAK
jgi:hypothetical protein